VEDGAMNEESVVVGGGVGNNFGSHRWSKKHNTLTTNLPYKKTKGITVITTKNF